MLNCNEFEGLHIWAVQGQVVEGCRGYGFANKLMSGALGVVVMVSIGAVGSDAKSIHQFTHTRSDIVQYSVCTIPQIYNQAIIGCE